jgi:hypothetical protein
VFIEKPRRDKQKKQKKISKIAQYRDKAPFCLRLKLFTVKKPIFERHTPDYEEIERV